MAELRVCPGLTLRVEGGRAFDCKRCGAHCLTTARWVEHGDRYCPRCSVAIHRRVEQDPSSGRWYVTSRETGERIHGPYLDEQAASAARG